MCVFVGSDLGMRIETIRSLEIVSVMWAEESQQGLSQGTSNKDEEI